MTSSSSIKYTKRLSDQSENSLSLSVVNMSAFETEEHEEGKQAENIAKHIDQLENHRDEIQQEIRDLNSERETLKYDLDVTRKGLECDAIRKGLIEAKAACELHKQNCQKYKEEMEEVTEERNFLVERIEQNQNKFKEQLSRELQKMKEQIDDLLDERSALLKKVEVMQLQRNVITKTVGTQADFTLDFIANKHDDNHSINSKTSTVTFGEMSALSGRTGISTMSGYSDSGKSNVTSDSRSIRMHASKVLAMAKKTIGVASRKTAVSDVSNTTSTSRFTAKSKNQLPPKPPRSSKSNKIPTYSRINKNSTKTPLKALNEKNRSSDKEMILEKSKTKKKEKIAISSKKTYKQ